VLTYEVEAQIGGKLAQLGSRLIKGVVNGLAEKFFTMLVAKVSQGSQSGSDRLDEYQR
jgi:carbon monoxide dehydrogenase subunit G